MVWTDRFTEMVIGRRLADQLDRARLEKMYEGAEERLKQTTHVACEPRLEVPEYDPRRYPLQRTESSLLELPHEGTIRPRRQKLQRSQSETVDSSKFTITSPSGPPDITAIDLSDDHIRRAYSQVDVRSHRSIQMPPLEQMTGFGKYRRSIHADPEWQMQKYRTNLRDFPGFVPQLGNFKLADPDPTVWDQFCQESARSNSFASSKTSHSDSSECPTDAARDRGQGPVITRGFAPLTASSAASSFRESNGSHTRKNSAPSTSSPSGESEHKLVRFHSRQSTLSHLCESTALGAINEDLTGDHRQGGKVSQFLPCGMEGDVENALEASDYEDEIEGSPTQLDGPKLGRRGTRALTLRPGGVRQTDAAQNVVVDRIKGQDLRPSRARDLKKGLDRSTTVIRKPVKSALRRSVSRGKAPTTRRVSIWDKGPTTDKINSTDPQLTELVEHVLTSSDEFSEGHGEHESGLYMIGGANTTTYQLPDSEDHSDPTINTNTTNIQPNLPTKTVRDPRRNRSGTAIHIVSGATQE